MINALPTEEMGLVGVIDADAYTAATYTTAWISAKEFYAFAALIAVGDLGTSATVDAKLEQAKDASGTGAKDVTGKLITQLTQAGSDSNKQAWINLQHHNLDIANDFDFFRLSMTVAVATSDAAGYVFGLHPAYGPATKRDLTSVDEVVN